MIMRPMAESSLAGKSNGPIELAVMAIDPNMYKIDR